MSESPLETLESKIDHLLDYCRRLERENQRLLQRERSLLAERSQLLQTRDSTRAKIEAMIGRLRAMEQN